MANKNVTIKRWNNTAWDIIYPKTTAENIISGTLDVDRIPNLDASKITSGFFSHDRIPNLLASKITSGTFDAARIPNLDASKITNGTFSTARIPDLDASKITSGTIDVARLPALAITDVTVDTTMEHFLPMYSPNPSVMQEGDVLILTTDNKTYIHNGGESGTASDFTLLSTPTAAVASVNGRTGVVKLTASDVNLGKVTNDAQIKKSTSSTDGYIPTWSGNAGDTLGTGYAISGTGSVAMTNSPTFTGTPNIGTGSPTWTVTDETLDQLKFINGGTIILPKVASGTKTIAFTDSVPTITGGASTIVTDNLTANMALISNASGKVVASSTISSTELGYLDGLAVNVQTGKQHSIKMGLSSALPSSSTFTGDIYLQTD